MTEPTRHPLVWDEIAICRDHGVKCQIDMAIEEVLRSLREEVAGMADHTASGYEWECSADEEWVSKPQMMVESGTGRPCPHYNVGDDAPISRAAIFAAIDRRLEP